MSNARTWIVVCTGVIALAAASARMSAAATATDADEPAAAAAEPGRIDVGSSGRESRRRAVDAMPLDSRLMPISVPRYSPA